MGWRWLIYGETFSYKLLENVYFICIRSPFITTETLSGGGGSEGVMSMISDSIFFLNPSLMVMNHQDGYHYLNLHFFFENIQKRQFSW